ncbi:MAG TPA: exodeoxyribonuclease VII small subunit [Acidimicrobiales bacterium]
MTTIDDNTTATDPAQLGYAQALTELESLLTQLEGDDVDVDVLGASVERAAALIAVCRERLRAAELQVERVVADLDDAPVDPAAPDSTDPDDD